MATYGRGPSKGKGKGRFNKKDNATSNVHGRSSTGTSPTGYPGR